jgi:hypothetical protein
MPLFLVPVIAWLAENFTTRAWRFAAAGFFLAALLGVVAALVATVAGLSLIVPEPVTVALSILMPIDWAAQVALVGAVHVSVYVWMIFKQAFEVATK